MLVVDPLHEIDLGVWKGLYEHLLRLLFTFGNRDKLAEMNERWVCHGLTWHLSDPWPTCRYRDIPSFGRDTIRKFSTNASEAKRKAGRDYEDLLLVGLISLLYSGALTYNTLSVLNPCL